MSSLLVGQSVQELLDSLMACGPLDSSPPPGATLTEPADQDAALASWAARLSAERGLPDPTVAPYPTGVEPGADPLLHALVATGVSEELAVHLAATVRACARSCSPATTTGTPDATSASTLRDAVSGQEAETLDATPTRARASELLGVVQTLTRATAQLEEVVLASTLQLTAAHAKLLLADKGLASPDELNATDRDRWRADAKSLTRGEIAAATGWGRGEVSDLVTLANTPSAVTGPVHAALGSGEAPWRLARRFHRAAADLPHELAAEVANGMFGSDPAAAVSERLDSAGKFTGQPWSHREFYRALDREIEKAKAKAELQDPDPGPDPKGKSRARLLAASDLWVTMDPDGTASVGFRCSATQAAAIAERIEAAARRARAGGDKRSLNVLRATIATALLLHGTLVKPTARVKPTAGADNGAGG